MVKIRLLVLTILYFLFGAQSVSANSILINEIMPRPSSDNEWVELYNTTLSAISLSGWILQEKTSSGNFNSYNLPDISILPNSFYVYEFSGSKLNDTGDTVNLLNPQGTLEDTYTYSSTFEDKTFARAPNGEEWISNLDPTKNSPNPTPLPMTTPSTSPSSTPIPNPSPTPPPTASFTISNVPSQINSDQSFSVNVNLSMPNGQNADYYLKGAFKKVDGTRYLGLTKKDSTWVVYNEDYIDQNKITTDSSGNWTGTLEVKPDTADSDYKGSGDYIFKISRYTANGSQSWSDNEFTIKIISTENNTSSTPTPSPAHTPSNTPITSRSPSPSPSKTPKPVLKIASIAGVSTSTPSATSTPKISVKNQKQTNPFLLVGSIFVIIGLIFLGFTLYRKRFNS